MKTEITLVAGFFLLLGSLKSISQNTARPGDTLSHQAYLVNAQAVYHGKVAFKLDYFGELVLHPGLSMGIDYTLSKKNWVTIHWDSEIGGYWHRWNNTALFFKTSIGTRLPVSSLFVDLNLGMGYMHAFAAGPVYQKSPAGGVEKTTNWGHPHFMPFTSLLVGWDGTRKMKLPWTFHVGAEIFLQSSFNHIFLPHAAARVGLTYTFKKKSL